MSCGVSETFISHVRIQKACLQVNIMTTVAFFCLSLEGALWEEPIYMTPKLKAKLFKNF